MKTNVSVLAAAIAVASFTCIAGAASIEPGVVVSVTQTTVQIYPDGSTVTTNKPLDAEQYASLHGLRVARPATDDAGNGDHCSGGSSGTLPPPGDQWPDPPSANDYPPNANQASTSVSYIDGWTLSKTWGRTLTPDGHGSYTDGTWTQSGQKATPPGGTQGDCQAF